MSMEFENEEERRAYYKKRIEAMKQEQRHALMKRKRMQRMVKQFALPVVAALTVFVIAISVIGARSHVKDAALDENKQVENTSVAADNTIMEAGNNDNGSAVENQAAESDAAAPDTLQVMNNPVPRLMDEIINNQNKTDTFVGPQKTYAYEKTESTGYIAGSDNMQSGYAILVNTDTGEVVAQKDGYERINPASMTKILTVLVAAEHLTEEMLSDKVTVTIDDTDYSYSNDCSAVGFAADEIVTVRDLLYGTILPSGGDAASALGKYIAGSREEFVGMMNEKLSELGLGDTSHFTNSVGLYDANHYSTLYDMAVIMNAAIDNELCREVMNAHQYTTSATAEHSEGITVSNWFLRRIEDKETPGEVLCAKTGYVLQSGNCAASYMLGENGTSYICVTADAHSSWRCIYDHVEIYKKYAG